MFHFMTLDIFENDLFLADKKSHSNVKLIISHNISRNGHTIGYYATNGKTKKVESKKKSYLNGESMVPSIFVFIHDFRRRHDLRLYWRLNL
jgi:hypothetical protein